MRILFLSRWFPYPANNGSKIRIFNLLRGLAQEHEVTLISFVEATDGSHEDITQLSFCKQIHTIPWKDYLPASRHARLGFFSTKPRSLVDTFSMEMMQQIERTLTSRDFDVVIASQFDTAVYNKSLRQLPALFEEVEVGVIYEKYAQAVTAWHRIRYGLTWVKYRRYLADLLKDYRACTVVSDREGDLLNRAVPETNSVSVIPNFVDLNNYCDVRESPQEDTIIFTGSFSYSPNYEAMTWFLNEVIPIIHAELPGVQLTITGDHDDLPLPASSKVTLTGFVDDVRPLIARSWISVVPIFTGGGTRIKILEAMALGTPVVATSKGAEGLDALHGEHLYIANDPQTFADATCQLLNNTELRQRIADNARQLIRDRYDYGVVLPKFLELVEHVAVR